jgi:hypothetical protein
MSLIILTTQAIGSIWATLSYIAVVVSAICILFQLREMRYTTHAQAYGVALEFLQDEKVRLARRTIFKLNGKPLEKWTKKETEAAEIVCYTYDVVGQMVRHHLLPKDIIIDSWGASLKNSWPILSLLIDKKRNDFNATEYWDDYEWLVIEAQKYRKHKRNIYQLLSNFHIHK